MPDIWPTQQSAGEESPAALIPPTPNLCEEIARRPQHGNSPPGREPAKAIATLNQTAPLPSTPAAGTSSAPPQSKATLLHVLILLLTAAVATRSIWGPALLGGHSAWIDLIRMVEFDASVHHGSLLPTWSPDLYFGHGSPLFQFYAPFCYYLTELPVLAGCDIPTALKITQLLALFASGLAMYRLAVTYFSGWAACLGGVLYMVAPYRLVDIYVRHALAEHCAFIWLPLIVWGTERFVTHRSPVEFAIGAFSTGLLIFSHNVMALIGLPVCVLAGWALSVPPVDDTTGKSSRARAVLIPLIAAGIPAIFGVGLATFFWWPAMSGRPLTQAEQSLTGGYYDFHNHFVAAVRFVALDWGFGSSGAGAQEKMSMQIGLPHLLLSLAAMVLLVRGFFSLQKGRRHPNSVKRQQQARWVMSGFVILAGAVFVCSQASHVFWENLPLIKYVQFPWRFLGLAVFGSTLCGAALADRLMTIAPKREQVICLAGLFIILSAYFPYYSQARFLAGDARVNEVMPMSPEKVDALAAAGKLIPLGKSVTPADIRRTNERATSSDDFLPRDVQKKPDQPVTELVSAPGNSVGPVTQPLYNAYKMEVEMKSAGIVELQQFWFPGWAASVDGLSTPASPTGPHADVSCSVFAGHHVVEFRYGAMPQRQTGLIVSVLALILGAVLTALLGTLHARRSKPSYIPLGSQSSAGTRSED